MRRNRVDVGQHHAAQTFLAFQRFHNLVDKQASLIDPEALRLVCDECAHGLDASAGVPALDVTQRSEEELVETHLFLRSVNDHRVTGQFHNMEETLREAKPGEHGSLEGVTNLHVLQLGIIDKIAKPVQEVDVHQVNAIYQSPVALIELLKVNVENVERLTADMSTNNLAQFGGIP